MKSPTSMKGLSETVSLQTAITISSASFTIGNTVKSYFFINFLI
jgi:hypothetical protein